MKIGKILATIDRQERRHAPIAERVADEGRKEYFALLERAATDALTDDDTPQAVRRVIERADRSSGQFRYDVGQLQRAKALEAQSPDGRDVEIFAQLNRLAEAIQPIAVAYEQARTVLFEARAMNLPQQQRLEAELQALQWRRGMAATIRRKLGMFPTPGEQ